MLPTTASLERSRSVKAGRAYGDPIDIGSFDDLVAVASEFRPKIIGNYHQNVIFFSLFCRSVLRQNRQAERLKKDCGTSEYRKCSTQSFS